MSNRIFEATRLAGSLRPLDRLSSQFRLHDHLRWRVTATGANVSFQLAEVAVADVR